MAAEQTPPDTSSTLVGKLIGLSLAVLVPIILALVVFRLVLLPALGGAAATPAGPDVLDPIPEGEVTVRFDMPEESVQTDNGGTSHPVLMYTVVLMCKDQLTADLISAEQDRFISKISSLHRNRTRAELGDPSFQDYLSAQVRDEVNILLKRLRPQGKFEVREATYLKFVILDL